MRTLILYASKYGFTADCANLLCEKLSGEVIVLDIESLKQPVSLPDYDRVILGSSVYVGKISKELREFSMKNLDELLGKEIGLFLCCALTENVDKFLKNNFPPKLLHHAIVIKTFGSDARLDKMSFIDKKIIETVAKGDFSGFKVLDENISKFVEKLR